MLIFCTIFSDSVRIFVFLPSLAISFLYFGDIFDPNSNPDPNL